MTIPALVLVVSHPAAFETLCGIGIAAGLFMFLFGVRPRPIVLPAPKPDVVGAVQFGSRPTPAAVQIIRLSPETGALKTADMTQQQKIAAALQRAGISNSAAWTNIHASDDESGSVQVLTAPPDATTVPAATIPGKSLDEATVTRPDRLKTIMLWAGLIVIFLSLYVLLHLKAVI